MKCHVDVNMFFILPIVPHEYINSPSAHSQLYEYALS